MRSMLMSGYKIAQVCPSSERHVNINRYRMTPPDPQPVDRRTLPGKGHSGSDLPNRCARGEDSPPRDAFPRGRPVQRRLPVTLAAKRDRDVPSESEWRRR
uniref:Transposase n=1 Tax=Steinernema glaseri TaxID=37863 RepID=A0A1I7YW83_9BILA